MICSRNAWLPAVGRPAWMDQVAGLEARYCLAAAQGLQLKGASTAGELQLLGGCSCLGAAAAWRGSSELAERLASVQISQGAVTTEVRGRSHTLKYTTSRDDPCAGSCAVRQLSDSYLYAHAKPLQPVASTEQQWPPPIYRLYLTSTLMFTCI